MIATPEGVALNIEELTLLRTALTLLENVHEHLRDRDLDGELRESSAKACLRIDDVLDVVEEHNGPLVLVKK